MELSSELGRMIEADRGPQQLHSTTVRPELAPLPQRQAIVVLGMHRSGTSALAGVINALGATVPQKTLMGADPCNLRGLFESLALAVAHDEMLASVGSCWDDWRRLNPEWFCSDAAQKHRQKIKSVLIDEYGEEPFIIVKDPRICRFMPFMSLILDELNFSSVAVLPIRNPLEVAYSLNRRDGFALSKSLLLWLRHVLDAELGSRHMRRCFLSYEDLLVDWRLQLNRVSGKLGVSWPERSENADVKVDQFLATELRHERVPFDEINSHPEMTTWVFDTYNVLRAAAAGGKNSDRLDQLESVRANFDEACHLFARTAPTEEAANERRGLNARGEASEAKIDSVAAQRPSRDGKAEVSSCKAIDVSIIVVVHNMAREAPRTLRSLSPSYQQGIDAEDYEVIVVDNGSSPPFDAKALDDLGGNFRLVRVDPAPPSPAHAINRGLAAARGQVIGVMIDGARIVTPGFIHFGRQGVRLYPRAVVATLGWYLGYDQQRWAMEGGYNQAREDELLASIAWPRDGYRLFEISAFDESTTDGWFAPISESNGLFLSRQTWDLLAGVDERFEAAGGGFVNLDTLTRALELPGSEFVVLLGEATFHQFHGGIATNAEYRTFPEKLAKWQAQYEAIRGRPLRTPTPQNRTYIGTLPETMLRHFARSLMEPARGLPLGAGFDKALWLPSPSSRPADATCAALLDLAENEFRAGRFEASAAVARVARVRWPDEPGPQRLLANAGPWLREKDPPDDRRAGFHFACAKAYRLLGDAAAAEAEFRAALGWDADFSEAHTGLANLRFPGEDYLNWLARLHVALAPKAYLEIGVWGGQTLALAQPPTRAIGIDPRPLIKEQFHTETHLFVETSDEFFARGKLEALCNDKPLDLVFIDGLHLFEQTLNDFINVEAHCARASVVLIHDTVPLDEPTQRRAQGTRFYTGDVWKIVPCLRYFRADLDIFTIPTPPTGLTVVTGLDPNSRVLAKRFDEAVGRFIDLPYAEFEIRLASEFSVVPNDWGEVEARLKVRGVL
jgi:hypothetical protein